MPLTRSFKELVQARAQRDPEFRQELLREGAECLLAGDLETGKAILRDYVNATIGFEGLAKATHLERKSIMRMLGPAGNPQAVNLFDIMKHLQAHERVQLAVRAIRPMTASSTVRARRIAAAEKRSSAYSGRSGSMVIKNRRNV